MANEVVQYPSYSQKAAYPVSHKPVGSETSIEHKPVAAETAIEPLPAEAVDFVEEVQATTPEVVDEIQATTADITETAPAPQDQAPKFFPLVPVSSEPVVEADAAVALSQVRARITLPRFPVGVRSVHFFHAGFLEWNPIEYQPFDLDDGVMQRVGCVPRRQADGADLGGSLVLDQQSPFASLVQCVVQRRGDFLVRP